MKKLFGLLILVIINIKTIGQVNIQDITPSMLSTLIPGFSEITSINNLSTYYTPSTPPVDPTPIDGDSTTMSNGPYKFGDVIPLIAQISNGNITNTSKGKVWTLKVSATNAKNIGILFDQCNLSDSAKMYIYDSSGTQLTGPIQKVALAHCQTEYK